MKNRITKIAVTMTLALVLVSAARLDAADKSGTKSELIMKNFEYSLERTEYPGIVESTVYNVVIFKNRFPELDYAPLATELKRVAEENTDATISYKAQLAYMYLNYSSTIDLTPGQTSPNYIFKEISEKLEQKFLVSQTIQ